MNRILLLVSISVHTIVALEKYSPANELKLQSEALYFLSTSNQNRLHSPVQLFLEKPLKAYQGKEPLSGDGFVAKIFKDSDQASTYIRALQLINEKKVVKSCSLVKPSVAEINPEHNFCYQKTCLMCCASEELQQSLRGNGRPVTIERHPLDKTEFLTESIEPSKPISAARSLCDSLGVSFQEISNRNDSQGFGAHHLLAMPVSEEQKIACHANIELHKEAERIINGGALAYELLFTSKPLPNEGALPDEERAQRLRSIVDYLWYLYHEQARKEEAFVEGTFTTVDKNSRVYDYFMRYVKGVNEAVTGTLQDPALTHAKNPFAYPRKSSHFKELLQRQYGIDIRADADGYCSLELPAQKGHLFFVKDENDTISIKMENYGLGYREVGHHALEFGIALLRKIPGVKKLFTSDDDPLYRKERIPAAFKTMVNAKIAATYDRARRALLKQAKVVGMKKLFEKESLDNSLIERLDKEYDHLPMRRGREGILTHETISSLYYYVLKNKPDEAKPIKNIFDALSTTRSLLKELKSADLQTIPDIEHELAQVLNTQLRPSKLAVIEKHNAAIHSYITDVTSAIHAALIVKESAARLQALTPRHGFLKLLKHDQ